MSNATLPEPYIPQTLSADGSSNLSVTEPARVLQLIFRDVKSAILIGKSGSGKSVLLRYLLLERSKQFVEGAVDEIPILINLRTDWTENQTISATIRNIVSGAGVELPLDVLKFLLSKGGFLLLVDSLNEVDIDNVKRVLNPFLTSNSRNRVLLAGQIDSLQRPQTRVIPLGIISEDEAKKYVATRVGSEVWEKLPIEAKALAQNPQNLEFLCEMLVATNCSEIPLHRADLYRSILEKDSALQPLAGTTRIGAVYRLAETMFESVRYSLLFDEVNELLRQFDVDATSVLDAVRRSRSFQEQTRRNAAGLNEAAIGFAHETMGKYLASRHIRSLLLDSEGRERIQLLAGDQRFEDVYKFMVDELNDGPNLSILLSTLLDRPGQSHLRIAAYIIATKPPALIEKRFIDLFTNAQVLAQAGESVIPANLSVA